MPDPIVILKAVIVAAVTTGLVILMANRIPARFGSRLGGAVGTGLGVLAGAWMLGLISRIPPRDPLDRFLLLLLPLAAAVDAITHDRVRRVLRFLIAASALPVLLYNTVYVTDLAGPASREWSQGLTAGLYVGFGLLLFLTWTVFTDSAERSARSMAIVVAGTAAGAALTVMLSGYASGGQLGLVLAAAAGVLIIVGGRHPGSGSGVVIVGLFGLLVVGRLFAALTTLNAALLFAAPLLAVFPELLSMLSKRIQLGSRAATGLRVVLPVIAVTIAMVSAQQKFAADSAKTPGEASASDYL